MDSFLNSENSLLKSMSIAFPEGKVNAIVPGAFLKIRVKQIDSVQYRNLKSISVFYNQEVTVEPASHAVIITLSEIKTTESEVVDGN